MNPLPFNARLPAGVTLLASALLLLSPLVLSFAGPGATSAYLLGALGLVLGAKALARPDAWDGWVVGAAGLLVAAMPWLAGFGASLPALWSHLLAGLVMLAAGLWALWTGRHVITDVDPDEVLEFQRKDTAGVGT